MNTQLQTQPKAASAATRTFTPVHSVLLQRKCACGGTPGPTGECESCRKKREATTLQRTAVSPGPVNSAPPIVHDVLRGPGQPLDAATRAFMEPRFGHDFSRVRVHTGAKAAESARAVDALAYTAGRNVIFGTGQYAPATSNGRNLLAHELTHVVQQAGSAGPHNELLIGPTDDPLEHQASAMAAHILDKSVSIPAAATLSTNRLQRAALHSGNILDEGTCEHLACNSRFACRDETNGVLCATGTRNAGERRRALFTCDRTCESGATCSDDDTWMAIPNRRFRTSSGGLSFRTCNQDLVICANGRSTHGYVRDRSNIEAWEVSRGIQTTLGVSGTFRGAVYPDESDVEFRRDPQCGSRSAAPKSEESRPQPEAGGVSRPPVPGTPRDNPSDQIRE